MLFKKRKKTSDQQTPLSGDTITTDGLSALAEIAKLACDTAACHAFPGVQNIKDKFGEQESDGQKHKIVPLREARDGNSLAGLVSGLALTGLRTTAFADNVGLVDMHNALYSVAGKRLPVVFCASCRAQEKHAPATSDGHDAYHAVADTGCLQFFAQDVQQAVDLTLIAHRIAELALTPGIVAFESHATGHSSQAIVLPDADLISEFLMATSDLIDSPTPAQKILFGEKRSRIPALFDGDHPIGIGAMQDDDSYFKAIASQRPYFFAHLAEITEQAFQKYGELSGRNYSPLSTYKLDDAEYVLLAQGAVAKDLVEFVDRLRISEKIKVGIIGLTMFRPFPGAMLSKMLQGKKAVSVLECLDQPLSEALPILKETCSAVNNAIENGRARNHPLPHPDYAAFQKEADHPDLFSCVYQERPDFDEFATIVRNMLPNGGGKKFTYAGIEFFKPDLRYPRLEMLQQRLQRDYPDLDRLSLAGDKDDSQQTRQPQPEPPTPWTVQEAKSFDETIYDLTRFWQSEGFLYESGKEELALADPFAALGTVPARSAAFHSAHLQGKQILRLIPENLAQCDLPRILAFAPEAGLQATLQDIPAILETAMHACEQNGHSFMHLPRLSQHLANQAYRLILKDDLQKYHFAGALFRDAFSELMQKMAPKDEQRAAFEQEMQVLCDLLETYIIVKIERYFDELHSQEKGTGLLLSFAINPDAYRDASACFKNAPQSTMEFVEATNELLLDYHKNWQLLMRMPEMPFERLQSFISKDQPETALLYLLNKKVYHAMLANHPDQPPSGAGIAMRFIAAAAEAVMQPRVQKLIQKLTDLLQKLEQKIQGKVAESVQINDFEAFGQRLTEEGDGSFDMESLAYLIDDGQPQRAIDKARLARLTSLHTQLKALHELYSSGASGDGRARMAAAFASRQPDAVFSHYPYNPFSFPWIQQISGNAPSQATGIFIGLMQKMSATFKAIRMAELELADNYKPEKHAPFFENFGWHDFTPEERQLCPPVFAIADIEAGFDAISQSLTSGLPLKFVALNSFGMQVPKVVQSGNSAGSTNQSARNEPGLFALLHRRCFVLQSSVGLPGLIMQGVLEGVAYDGAAFFHLYAPNSHEKEAAAKIFNQAELAVASRAFPVFSFNPAISENWGACLNLQGNPHTEKKWAITNLSVKQPNGLVEEIQHALTPADWAAKEPRFEKHFKLLQAKQWHDTMMPVADYLMLAPEKRQGIEPFVQYIDHKQHLQRLVVSRAIVAMAEDRAAFWKLLNELTNLGSTTAEQIEVQVKEQVEAELSRAKVEITREYEAKLAQLQNEHDRLYHAKLTQKLLAMSGFGQNSGMLKQRLREFAVGENHNMQNNESAE